MLQNNLKKTDRIDRVERNQFGHESIIVKAKRCVHRGSLQYFLYFCLHLKFSIIPSFWKKSFLQDFELVTANFQNTWNVKHCLKHFICLFNAYRNPSEINTVIHPILYLGNWRHRKLNNLPTAACFVTGRAETSCGSCRQSGCGVCVLQPLGKETLCLAPTWHKGRAPGFRPCATELHPRCSPPKMLHFWNLSLW